MKLQHFFSTTKAEFLNAFLKCQRQVFMVFNTCWLDENKSKRYCRRHFDLYIQTEYLKVNQKGHPQSMSFMGHVLAKFSRLQFRPALSPRQCSSSLVRERELKLRPNDSLRVHKDLTIQFVLIKFDEIFQDYLLTADLAKVATSIFDAYC